MRRTGPVLFALIAVSRLGGGVAADAASASPIRHVVILIQENHSFDNVLGKLCLQVARGAIVRPGANDLCDGASDATLSDGTVLDPIPRSADYGMDVAHNVQGQRRAIDGGSMDGFDALGGCGPATGYACVSGYAPTQIPNLAALAERFTISDRTFEFKTTPSWAGHMVLASATT
ncbi:MAG: hypothetical protein M3P18_21455, partial [Actinomycetota bacterium]|nr:hypothetical protein [Actinomycetota bacterium]